MAVLADEYGPFNAGPGASVGEPQWGRIYESLSSSGVSPKVLNELKVTQHGAGNMSVDVASGQVFLHGHQGRWESVSNLSIAANASGITRYDRVIGRSDRTSNTTMLDVLPGSAGSPAALTQNDVIWEEHIATVTVANGAGSILNADIAYVPTWASGRSSAPSALASIATAPMSIPTGVNTVPNLGTPFTDTGNYWSASNPSRFTVSHKGLYLVGAQIQIDKSNAGANNAAAMGKGTTSVGVQYNGGTSIFVPQVWRFNEAPVAGTGAPFTTLPTTEFYSVAGPVPMVAGNYVEIFIFQYSGVTMSALNGQLWIVDLGVA
jgi:hypothetical protein